MRRRQQPATPRSSRKRRRLRIGALLGSVVLIVVIGGVRWRRDRLEFVMLLHEHTGTTLRRLPHNASLVGETESSGLWADGSKAPGFENGALHPAGLRGGRLQGSRVHPDRPRPAAVLHRRVGPEELD